MTSNTALADELEAVGAIYTDEVVSLVSHDATSTVAVLKLPTLPFSFSVSFPNAYPDIPPQITGTQSTGPNTKKGEGEAALNILRDVLLHIFTPGQVCIFDLVEEVTPLLQAPSTEEDPAAPQRTHLPDPDGSTQDLATTTARSAAPSSPHSPQGLTGHDPATTISSASPSPNWTPSDPLVVNKSTFLARALHVTSVPAATAAVSHLLSTDKKAAAATHNITAWRVRTGVGGGGGGGGGGPTVAQDFDDDGETAAGGRLLHLLQLVDAWDVLVVVSRWYGGVKLGPDRFRCINAVARESLVRGGFVGGEGKKAVEGKGRGKKK